MTDADGASRWREEGRAIAAALDEHGAAAIIARDPDAAAEVALGIAEVQARRRRVAVADLAGETPALQSLVPDDVVHGVIDAFAHGVSLNRIAHPVDRAGNLFIMQSGAGPIDYPTILRDDRWRRLANGFRETNALLLAVVPEGAPGVDALAHELGAIVAVEDARLPGVAPVVAHVGEAPAPEAAAVSEAQPAPRPHRPSPPDAVEVLRRRTGPQPRVREKAGIGLWIAIAAGLLLGAGAALGWTYRERFGWFPDASTPLTQPTEPVPPSEFGAVANPADSARASAFIVVIANVTDSASARQRILESLASLPAPTFSPDTPWYRVSVGAFGSEAEADSLLRTLRTAGLLEPESGYLLRAPYSLHLTSVGDTTAVRDSLESLRVRGVPAFALRESDATITLYAGAYETAAQAADALAVSQLAVPGAVVAYRVGRAY